ncbi:uncharacterized protein LOC142167321 [Nicotiana tabacum]|uniref:Uncharacterized protein LOC142167321 n=1 Tax=Nicotiana tabacum TaxID=4097 RepID=A0AC58SF31_TOBAC
MTTSAEQQNNSVGTTAAMETASSSRTTPAPAMAPVEKPEMFFGVDFKRCCLEGGLYNVYSVMKTSRELWNDLGKKYKTEDAGLKKFVAAKFLDFKMVDGMVINEAFQVAAFIEKLFPLWKDFKNYLKHKHKKITLEDLIVRLRIEEDNKATEKKSRGNSTIMGANIVEEASTSKKRKKSSGPKNYPSKKKFKGNCHNCVKVGHKATECRAPKKDKKKSQANMIEKNDEIDDLCAMLSECNLVGNPREWWIDSGANRHVCTNKELFTSYAPAGPNKTVFMENSATAKIEGTSKIALKMTSCKIVTQNDVLHIPKMRKNLVSTSLLVKNGFKCVFVSDKVVVSKNEMYVGKDYLTEGLFKLNVIDIDMNKIPASSYLLCQMIYGMNV